MFVIPALWEAKSGGALEPRSWRRVWATQQDLVSTKTIFTVSQTWWHATVVPVTQGAEAGGSLEPKSLRLQ